VISTEASLVYQQPALTASRLIHLTLLFLNSRISRGFVGSRLTEISFGSTFPAQQSFLKLVFERLRNGEQEGGHSR
jgi:hypothetical protein